MSINYINCQLTKMITCVQLYLLGKQQISLYCVNHLPINRALEIYSANLHVCEVENDISRTLTYTHTHPHTYLP